MNIRFCPFCKTGTFYAKRLTEQAAVDASVRVQCVFCHLKFWPGTREDLERARA